jgi:hypothetical protein
LRVELNLNCSVFARLEELVCQTKRPRNEGRLAGGQRRVLFLVDEDAFIEEVLVPGSKATL